MVKNGKIGGGFCNIGTNVVGIGRFELLQKPSPA